MSRPPIGRREVIIAVFAVAALVVSVLAYSSVPLTGQVWTFVLSALSFAFLFLPVGYDGWRSRTAADSWRALRKFPLFWLGLALFALMAIQGLNPAWGVVQRTFYWRIYAQEHIGWLPSGLAAPFASEGAPGGMNAFRQMLIFGGPWLVLCALWAGVERRRTWIAMTWALVSVGLCLAAWGAEMRISGTKELTGIYTLRNTSFFASFLYQNQAGAWLSLQFALAVSLALWHWENAVARDARSGPHLLAAAVAVCLVIAAVCTLSFGGMLTITVLLLGIAPVAVLWGLLRNGVNRGVVWGGAIATVLLLGVAGMFYATTDLESVEAKLMRKFQLANKSSLDDRAPLRRATWALILNKDGERLWTGYGAGSYRWVSPVFFSSEPTFLKKDGSLRVRANYAHCDWLQMLSEWGVVGVSLVAGAILWMLWFLARNWRKWTPVSLILVAAVALFMGHACMDFLCYSMPLLGLVAFVVTLAVKLGLARSGPIG